jgi:hypothetical protein
MAYNFGWAPAELGELDLELFLYWTDNLNRLIKELNRGES